MVGISAILCLRQYFAKYCLGEDIPLSLNENQLISFFRPVCLLQVYCNGLANSCSKTRIHDADEQIYGGQREIKRERLSHLHWYH